jgi:hypothetical protein
MSLMTTMPLYFMRPYSAFVFLRLLHFCSICFLSAGGKIFKLSGSVTFSYPEKPGVKYKPEIRIGSSKKEEVQLAQIRIRSLAWK